MIEPPMDQSILKDKTVTLVFDGQPEQFYDVMLGYMISKNNISYPYKWTLSPNKKAFILEIIGGSLNHRPVTLFPSPLPRSRSQLHFQIPEYNFEEYYSICTLLVDYLKDLGWIEKDKPLENPQINPNRKEIHLNSAFPENQADGESNKNIQAKSGEIKKPEEIISENWINTSEDLPENSPSSHFELPENLDLTNINNYHWITDVERFRPSCASYDSQVMRKVILEVPTRYTEWKKLGNGQWGPGLLKVGTLSSSTISRYLGALYYQGVRSINGVPIPYKPRKKPKNKSVV